MENGKEYVVNVVHALAVEKDYQIMNGDKMHFVKSVINNEY